MNLLITAGPTQEPIDPVRYIGNRSSGKMGAALAEAALRGGHCPTLILGPVSAAMPPGVRRIDVTTAAEMYAAVMKEFPAHDALIMAAAVADYRPKIVHAKKLGRGGALTIELETTEDIVAAASASRRPGQKIIGFSLESAGNIDRAREKLARKNLDLIVFNPTETMNSSTIDATMIYPDGRTDRLSSRSKTDFAEELIRRLSDLFKQGRTN